MESYLSTELICSNNFLQGLENAVFYLLPHAEHRNCARHIFANWKKKGHSTEALRVLFWKAVVRERGERRDRERERVSH